jgi:hypothetical protein
LGSVTDEAGRPLADADVRLYDVTSAGDGRYESPREYKAKSDADGRFRVDQVPVGRVTVRTHKSGYFQPGPGLPLTTPAEGIVISMELAASLRVTVDFTGTQRPAGYAVIIEPEGGDKVGSYGGGGDIDEENQIRFENVPPGRYVLVGCPNPSRGDPKRTQVTIELKGGEKKEVTLSAK